MTSIKSLAATVVKYIKTSGKKSLNMPPQALKNETISEAISKGKVLASEKVPLCHQIWGDTLKEGGLKPYPYRCVEHHADFNFFNHLLIKGRVNYGMEEKLMNTSKTIKKAIYDSDIHFKRLKPIEQNLTVYRCVGEKPEFFEFDSKLYKKVFNTKAGDVIVMPEYAYAAGGTSYSNVYRGVEGRRITYEIEVPKGARVSCTSKVENGKLLLERDECVFPRFSKFQVLESEILEDGSCYKKVRYILPDEPWRG